MLEPRSLIFLIAPGIGVYLLLLVLLKSRIAVYFLDKPNSRKIHKNQIPRIGGLALIPISCLGISIASGLTAFTGSIFAGALVFTVIGLFDDSSLPHVVLQKPQWFLRARYKFLLESALAFGVIYYTGVTLPGLQNMPWLGTPLTMVWLVGVTNSFNIIDGVDGLCGGVSFVILLGIVVLALLLHIAGVMPIALVLAGSVGGFLVLNSHPARLFLGDMGSLFLGFCCALLGLEIVVNIAPNNPFLLLFLAALPVLDVGTAMVRRSFVKPAPTSLRQWFSQLARADANHIHHRLLRQGLSASLVALVAMLWTLAVLVLAFMALSSPAQALWYLPYLGICVLACGLLYISYRD